MYVTEITEFRGQYAFLSNFYESRVQLGQVVFRNAEAAFQSRKCSTEMERYDFAGLNLGILYWRKGVRRIYKEIRIRQRIVERSKRITKQILNKIWLSDE